jgi:putative ABC transport system permease protein
VIGDIPFQFEEFFREDEVIPDIFVTVTSPFTGQSRQLQVIGVLEAVAFYSGGPLLTSQEVLTSLAPVTLPANSYLIQVKEGVDVATTAKALEATFVENGLQVTVTAEEIKQQANANLMLNSLLQGFMSLGLVVGIAALGVISARTVVERYHQIGVLRAIGFQRGMVQLAFILESSFIALLGIALGIALGMGISRNVIESFSESIDGIQYAVPWSNIIAVAVIAYGASLLMTLIAARQAAKVQPAEALRFE